MSSDAADAHVTLFTVPPVAAEGDLATLTGDEQTRAARFAFDRDRSAFVTTRAALRRTLAESLGCTTADIVFETERWGRLRLISPVDATLDFNVSHSGALSAVAITRGRRIGVDIEWHHGQRGGLHDIVPRIMGPREQAMLRETAPAEFVRAFFGCWTRKESVVKATGIGMSYPVETLDIPGAPASGIMELPVELARTWRLVTLEPVPHYTLSVAMTGATGAIYLQHTDGVHEKL
jgi:4'-phosphopantetheinyl transferase